MRNTLPIPPVPSTTTAYLEKNQSRRREKYQLTLEKDGKSLEFELVPQPDSVAILLYHLQQQKFLLLRKFRPAVYASRVRQLPENRVRISEKVKWNVGDRSTGYTIELCSGVVDDRKKSIENTALAVVEEEFGYRVEKKNLQHIASFVTGMSESGACRHLFYAVINEEGRKTGGRIGGRDSVHQFLSVKEVEQFLSSPDPHTFTADYYALIWLFNSRGKKVSAQYYKLLARNLFSVQFMAPPLRSVRISPIKKIVKEKSLTILIQDNGMTRTWDTTPPIFDTFSVLIKETDNDKEGEEEKVVVTRRFRPAVLIARVRALPQNEGKSITEIDFSAYPSGWAYTVELASDKVMGGEAETDAVLRIAASQLGYRIPRDKLQLKTKLVIGSSHGGDSKHIYYAECGKEHRIEGWTEREGVQRVKYRCSEARSMLRMPDFEFPLPPSVLIAFDRCLTQ